MPGVPYTFGSATAPIPLSNLDTNFATPVTIGNTTVALGNTVTTINAVTLTNATVSSGNVTVTSASLSGNLTFTGTGQRITGDFSNATVANRVMFQNSVTNGNTTIFAIPNGTGTTAYWAVCGNSDPTNAATGQFYIDGNGVSVRSAITGTGTYLPLTFYTGGSEKMRIDTSGSVGIGGVPSTGYSVQIRKNITGAVGSAGLEQLGVVQSDVTSLVQGVSNILQTAATS